MEVERGGTEDAHVATERVVDVERRRREVAIRIELERDLDELSLAIPPCGILCAGLPADPLVASLSLSATGRGVVLAEVAGALLAVGELPETVDQTVSAVSLGVQTGSVPGVQTVSAGDDGAVVRVVEEVEFSAASIALTNVVRQEAVYNTTAIVFLQTQAPLCDLLLDLLDNNSHSYIGLQQAVVGMSRSCGLALNFRFVADLLYDF